MESHYCPTLRIQAAGSSTWFARHRDLDNQRVEHLAATAHLSPQQQAAGPGSLLHSPNYSAGSVSDHPAGIRKHHGRHHRHPVLRTSCVATTAVYLKHDNYHEYHVAKSASCGRPIVGSTSCCYVAPVHSNTLVDTSRSRDLNNNNDKHHKQ